MPMTPRSGIHSGLNDHAANHGFYFLSPGNGVNFSQAFDNNAIVWNAATAADGQSIVCLATTGHSTVGAYDLATGEAHWFASLAVIGTTNHIGDDITIDDAQRNLTIVDAANGRSRFIIPIPDSQIQWLTPMLRVNDTLYVSTFASPFLAIDLVSGGLAWQRDDTWLTNYSELTLVGVIDVALSKHPLYRRYDGFWWEAHLLCLWRVAR